MRKLILAFGFAVALAGCSGQSIFSGGPSLTASIDNPVTPALLYEIENAATVATTGLLTYRRLCVAGKIPPTCRATIVKIQVFTRPLKDMLAQLRLFVKNNDQINAITVFNSARAIITSIEASRAASDVNAVVGGKS